MRIKLSIESVNRGSLLLHSFKAQSKQFVLSIRTDRADRGAPRPAAHEYAVATGNHPSHCFSSFGVNLEWLVVNALLNLEAPDRLAGISSFVHVSRHRP